MEPKPTRGRDILLKQCTKFKGDHCMSPLRQVFQLDDPIGEPVDEATMRQMEHGTEQKFGKQETPQDQHPLIQDGSKRCTKKECAQCAEWQVANGWNERKS